MYDSYGWCFYTQYLREPFLVVVSFCSFLYFFYFKIYAAYICVRNVCGIKRIHKKIVWQVAAIAKKHQQKRRNTKSSMDFRCRNARAVCAHFTNELFNSALVHTHIKFIERTEHFFSQYIFAYPHLILLIYEARCTNKNKRYWEMFSLVYLVLYYYSCFYPAQPGNAVLYC